MKRIYKRLISLLPNFRIFKVYSIHELIEVIKTIPLEFRDISLENIEEVSSFRDKIVLHYFCHFLERGDLGIYGYSEDKVVVHGWAITNDMVNSKKVNGYFLLPGKSAFIHFCSVDLQFRGKKVYQALLVELCKKLSDYDIYIDTNVWNIPAQKAIEHMGGSYIYILKALYWGSYCIYTKKIKND